MDYTEKRKEEIGKITHALDIMDGHKKISCSYNLKTYSFLALLQEFGRNTDALNRIAKALEKQNKQK